MVKRSRSIAFLLIALLLIAGLAACGGDDDNDSESPENTGGEVSVPDQPNDALHITASDHIAITDPWVRATVPGAESDDSGRVTGAYMHIANSGSEPDKLVSVMVDPSVAGSAEIHETTLDENDVMQMRPVDSVEIPANGNTVLKPGSYHIMLLDVQRDLNPGETVPLTLTFESGVSISVNAEVRALE